MAFTPISNTVPQYEENGIAASGFYIKFYEAGTTTPTAMATDSTGGTLLDKCELNTEGYPINGSSAVFIPHIDKKYKIALFRNAADADSNNLANAAWPAVDNLFPVATSNEALTTGSELTSVPLNSDLRVDTIALLRLQEPTTDGQQISVLGYKDAGVGGEDFYFDVLDAATPDNGVDVIVTSGGKRWKLINRKTITTSQLGALSTDTPAEQAAALSRIQELSPYTTVVFDDVYTVDSRVTLENMSSITLKGPGGIKKDASFNNLDNISFKNSQDITIDGMQFEGAQDAFALGPLFGDQGLGFFSCQRVRILNNTFLNFGDAAHRILRSSDEPSGTPTDATDTIISGNTYRNIQQTSTTTGGTRRLIFSNNIGININGSFKFASRAPGSGLLLIEGNVIENSNGHCFELAAQDQALIDGNLAKNISGTFLFYESNPNQEASTEQKMLTITSNNIDVCDRLARVSNNNHVGGFSGVVISDNIAKGDGAGDSIVLTGSLDVDNVKIFGNQLESFTKGVDLAISEAATFDAIDISSNTFIDITVYAIDLGLTAGENGFLRISDNISRECDAFIVNTSLRVFNDAEISRNNILSSGASARGIAVTNDSFGSNTGIYDNIIHLNSTGIACNLDSNNIRLGGNHFENNGTAAGLRFNSGLTGIVDMGGNAIIGGYTRNSVVVTNGVTDLTV